MPFPAQLVIIHGSKGAGKTALAAELAQKLEYRVFLAHDATAVGDDLESQLKERLCNRFRDAMNAVRHAYEQSEGVVLDSLFSWSLAELEHEARHFDGDGRARLPTASAERLLRFGKSLLPYLPTPHIIIALDASAAACQGRARVRRCLHEFEEYDAAARSLTMWLSREGAAVYYRDWEEFGNANSVRDVLLCAPPQTKWAASLKKSGQLLSDADVASLLTASWEAAAAPPPPLAKQPCASPTPEVAATPLPPSKPAAPPAERGISPTSVLLPC